MEFAGLKNIRDVIYQGILKYKYHVRWALALAVAVIVIIFYQLELFQRLELLSLDCRFRLRTVKPIAADIVFIDMAEDSIQAIGRWPWPRAWHATLIKALSDYKPKAIVFDILFSEPQDEKNDLALEEALRLSGVTYLPLLFNLKEQDTAYLYGSEGVLSMIEPLPQFGKYAIDEGHINAIPDIDGILRRVPPIISFKGKSAYQLGLKVGLDVSGAKDSNILFYPDRHLIVASSPENKNINIPLDSRNQLIVNWKQRWGREFKHFSYVNVIKSYALIQRGLASPIDFNEFRGKVCVIGLTAAGLTDIKPVPIQSAYPAVGINAMVMSSVINREFIYDLSKVYNMLIILLVSMLVTFYLSNFRLIGGIAIAAAGIICYFFVSILIFNIFDVVISTFYPIAAIVISYGFTSLYAQVLQSVERTRLFKQATRDGLTNLYNIRHFNLLLEAELKNVSTDKRLKRLAIIMSDVDNFKHINDTYGHQAGDIVLKEFAKAIQSKCRQTDIVARYGGEEFVIMLAGAGQKEAMETAERIRADIQDKKFKFKNSTYGATISIGVVEFSNEGNKEELIGKADKALYNAKLGGKNRVCLYSKDLIL